VQPLQVRIGTIARVTQPVIGERDDLGLGEDQTAGNGLLQRGISAARVFVDVIAEVDHQVDVLSRGGMAIGVEVAERQVRAAEHAELELAHGPVGQRARAASRRGLPGRVEEAVEVPAARGEPAGDRLDAPVAFGRGFGFAGRDDCAELRVARHLPAQAGACAGFGEVARPQHDPVRARLAAGHIVGEATQGENLRPGGQGQHARAERGALEQQSAIDQH
jgi:hypothetical protein